MAGVAKQTWDVGASPSGDAERATCCAFGITGTGNTHGVRDTLTQDDDLDARSEPSPQAVVAFRNRAWGMWR